MADPTGRWPTPGCFDDVRVLEIGDEKSEFCGLLLAGEGAEVIKIEPPGGGASRSIGPFYQGREEPNGSLFFWTYNRAKRGVTLDLTKQAGRVIYRDLVASADVVIDGRGAGVMDGLGLGYDGVRQVNPDVLYCSITPFGLTGPWRDFKGSDLVHLALGGSTYCCGYDAVSPGKWDTAPMTPQAWHAYCVGGEHAAMAVAATLLYRQATGDGQLIDVSIHDACAQCTEGTVPRYIYNRTEQPRRSPNLVKCADGDYLNLMFLPPADVGKVASLLAQCDMAEDLADPKYRGTSFAARIQLMPRVTEVVGRWAATRPVMEVFQALQSCGVACAPVRPPEELISDPHCIERQDFVEVEHPELGKTFVYPRAPRHQTETPWRWGPRAPMVGEHNGEVYGTILGMSEEQLADYRSQGVL